MRQNQYMGTGERAHNGDEQPRIRVLPSDGVRPIVTESAGLDEFTPGPRRLVSLVAGLAVLGVILFVVRGPDKSETPTKPPPLSGFENEYIDLRAAERRQTTTWDQVTFPEEAVEITDLAVSSNLAVTGKTADSPMVWLSATGGMWREVSQLEYPENGAASIEWVVPWQRSFVGLGALTDGVTVWRSSGLSVWVVGGPLDGMTSVEGLVAGGELLAVGTTEDGSQAVWSSEDGLAWVSLGESDGLDGITVEVYAADDAWYYAGGVEACATGACRPVIYRSFDGITWQPTSGTQIGALAAEPGVVRDIVAGDDGLYAVGTVGGAVAVWHSVDGSAWTRISEDSPELTMAGTTLGIVSTSPGDNLTAVITVDAERYTVGVGSRVATLSGDIAIEGIADTSVTVRYGARLRSIAPGGSITLAPSAEVSSISVLGHRILLGGNVVVEGRQFPVVWLSTDAGLRWHMTFLAPRGGVIAAALSGSNLNAIGDTPVDGLVVWHAAWDTSAAQAAGLAALGDFVESLNTRDVPGLIALLPERADAMTSVAIPSLSATDLGWWGANGSLRTTAVADTVDYLEAMSTDIRIDDCRSESPFGEPDTVTANCGFIATSELLTTVGTDSGEGRIVAEFVDGSLQSIELRNDPGTRAWLSLQAFATTASPAEQATLLGTDDSGTTVLQPHFDGETAVIHLEMARRFAGGQLRPGGTTTVDTVLGTMEWRWIDLPFPAQSTESAAYFPATNEFVVVGHGEPGVSDRLSIWTSQDGLEWEQQPGPEVDTIWDLTPIGDELVGHAWVNNQPGLAFFDGSDWTLVPIDPNPPGTWANIEQFAISGDSVLVVTRYWSEGDPSMSEAQAWLVGPDRTAHNVTPPPDLPFEGSDNLAGNADGFTLTVAGAEPGEMTTWHSEDGMSWSSDGATTFPEATPPTLNGLEWHGGRFYGVGGALSCASTAGSQDCWFGPRLWSSADGYAWEPVMTDSGDPVVLYEIASGPLGLAGIEWHDSAEFQPRALYLSASGTSWQRAGSLTFFDPAADWWWTTRPAVGTDVIVITGSSVQEPGLDDPFLLVGRVVDP